MGLFIADDIKHQPLLFKYVVYLRRGMKVDYICNGNLCNDVLCAQSPKLTRNKQNQ